VKLLRQAVPLIAGIVLIGLATVLVLFALDARAWQGRFTQGDLRFRAQRSHIGLWRSPAVLPLDPAGSVLGIDDALQYRRAIQLFWFSTAGASTGGKADLAATRVAGETDLQKLVVTGATRQERSNAANLLGVMTVEAPENSATQKQEIAAAIRYFTQAVRIDPTNYDAKLNLELLLRVAHPGKNKLNQDARGGFGFGGANGVGAIGGGL
jgi:hypothetical protein